MMKGGIFRELSSTLEEIRITAGMLARRGWSEGSGGNMSIMVRANLPDPGGRRMPLSLPVPELEGETILVTCSGSRMRDLALEPEAGVCLIRIEKEGDHCTVFPEDARPTSELPAHLTIQQVVRTEGHDFRAVLHTQPTALVALTHISNIWKTGEINDVLFRMHPETAVVLPERAALIPYGPPGSEELALKTAEAFRNHRLAIWEKHGTVSVGRTLDEALDYVEILEKAAEIYFLVSSTGVKPSGLTDAQLERTLKAFRRR